jgi:single-stranded-DNA-specific exonuclease
MTRIVSRTYAVRQAALLAEQGLHPVMARLMAARGLTESRQLSTALDALIAPAGLLHIDKAATFLADAIDAGKKMVIVADYDCDGATACAVRIRGLRALGAHCRLHRTESLRIWLRSHPEIVALTVTSQIA